jgi:hypothetical protein
MPSHSLSPSHAPHHYICALALAFALALACALTIRPRPARSAYYMSSSQDGAAKEQAVAAAVERARDAIAALAEPPAYFLCGMQSALQKAEAALQREPRELGSWALPHKRDHLTRLRESDPRRPAREEAYAAMEGLKAVGFPAASATDRSRKSKMGKRQRQADEAAEAAAEAAADEDQPTAPEGARQRSCSHACALARALRHGPRPPLRAALRMQRSPSHACALAARPPSPRPSPPSHAAQPSPPVCVCPRLVGPPSE